jgi:hypothetical protein
MRRAAVDQVSTVRDAGKASKLANGGTINPEEAGACDDHRTGVRQAGRPQRAGVLSQALQGCLQLVVHCCVSAVAWLGVHTRSRQLASAGRQECIRSAADDSIKQPIACRCNGEARKQNNVVQYRLS